MTRRALVAGNWKMNLDRERATALARGILEGSSGDGAEIAVFPPFVYLDAVGRVLESSPIAWGGQNMHFATSGAFTGEISGPMLTDLGARYVIVGHSERRHVFGESAELVGRKVAAAFEAGLVPVLCVGETIEQRRAGETRQVVFDQLAQGVAGITPEQAEKLVVAYEPVWAIGTGETATPEQAQEVHADLRGWLTERYSRETAARIRIQYGGSVKPSNAAELLAQDDIDGALVGGASLEVESFLAIVAAAR